MGTEHQQARLPGRGPPPSNVLLDWHQYDHLLHLHRGGQWRPGCGDGHPQSTRYMGDRPQEKGNTSKGLG